MFIIGRYINGNSLNGLEYLQGDDGRARRFDNIKEAQSFLIDSGVPEEELEHFVFEEVLE